VDTLHAHFVVVCTVEINDQNFYLSVQTSEDIFTHEYPYTAFVGTFTCLLMENN
jgi:hypothetical protein